MTEIAKPAHSSCYIHLPALLLLICPT